MVNICFFFSVIYSVQCFQTSKFWQLCNNQCMEIFLPLSRRRIHIWNFFIGIPSFLFGLLYFRWIPGRFQFRFLIMLFCVALTRWAHTLKHITFNWPQKWHTEFCKWQTQNNQFFWLLWSFSHSGAMWVHFCVCSTISIGVNGKEDQKGKIIKG